MQNDWRKKFHFEKGTLLESFYTGRKLEQGPVHPSFGARLDQEELNPFLNENMINDPIQAIHFWKKHSSVTSTSAGLTLSLRILYKLFGAQAEEDFSAQNAIVTGIKAIFGNHQDPNHMSLKSSPLIMDFIRTLLFFNKTQEEDDDESIPFFNYEFGNDSERQAAQQRFESYNIEKKAMILNIAIIWNYSKILNYFKTKLNKIQKNTLLGLAVKHDVIDMAEFLLNNGADVDTNSYHRGESILALAISDKKREMIDLLLKKGANIKKKDNYGKTILMYASEYGFLDIVKKILDQDDPSASQEIHNTYQIIETYPPNTALSYAFSNRNWEIAQFLIEKGSKLDFINDDGQTLLMLAMQSHYNESEKDISLRKKTIEITLLKHPDISARDKTGKTILMYAAEYNFIDVAQYILDQSPEMVHAVHKGGFHKTDYTAIRYAARQKNWEIAKLLLNHGADVNTQIHNENPTSLLKKVATDCEFSWKMQDCRINWDMIEFLLKKGATDVNFEIGPYKPTSFVMYVIRQRQFKILKLLLDKKVNLNVQEKYKKSYYSERTYTPFTLANDLYYEADYRSSAKADLKEIIKLLLSINIDTGSKKSALMHAIEMQEHDLTNFLAGKATPLQTEDDKGKTTLMYAAEYGFIDIVKAILKQTDINVNQEHQLYAETYTALKYAGGRLSSSSEHWETIKILIENGANINEKIGYDKKSLLYIAAHEGNWDLILFLLEKGATDVNILYEYPYDHPKHKTKPPLIMAAIDERKTRIVELLLKKNVKLNIKGKISHFYSEREYTPYSLAKERAYIENQETQAIFNLIKESAARKISSNIKGWSVRKKTEIRK